MASEDVFGLGSKGLISTKNLGEFIKRNELMTYFAILSTFKGTIEGLIGFWCVG